MRIVSANPSISKKANFKDNKRILSAHRDRIEELIILNILEVN